MKKILLVFIIFSVVITGCSMGTTSNNTSWNSDANASNGNTFFGYKGDVYFNNLLEGGIYRLHKEPQKMTKVVDGTFVGLQVEDDWIYTRKVAGEEGGLYKINTNEKKTEQLIPLTNPEEDLLTNLLDDQTFTGMAKSGDFLYYVDSDPENGGIYQLHLEKGEEVRLVDDYDAKYLYVFGEWLYYLQAEGGHVFRVKIDGSEQERVTTDRTSLMMMDNEWIYYYHEGTTLKRTSHDGKQEEVVKYDYTRWIQYMNIKDNWIYVSALIRPGHNVNSAKDQGYTNWELYKINALTKERIPLYVGVAKNIHIINDYIYFYGDLNFYRMNLDGTELIELLDV